MRVVVDQGAETIKNTIKDYYQIYAFPSPRDGIWKYLEFTPEMDENSIPNVEGTPVPHDKDVKHAHGWIKYIMNMQGMNKILFDYYPSLTEACKDNDYLVDCNFLIGQ